MTTMASRLSGLSLIIGAVLLGTAMVALSFNPVVNQLFPPFVNWLFMIGSILLLLSLPAMYARQANASGWLGLTGHALLQAGILLLVVVAAPPLLYPTLKEASGNSVLAFGLGIALTLGLLLTGLTTFRAGIYPRAAGALLLAAMAGFVFDFFVAEFLPAIAGQAGSALFGVLLALGLAAAGRSMFANPALSSRPTGDAHTAV